MSFWDELFLGADWSVISAYIIGAIVLYVLCSPKLVLKLVGYLVRLVLIRLRVSGMENLPYSGPTLLVSNHISLLDLILLQCVTRQRIRFLVRSSVVSFLPTRLIFRYLGVLEVPNSRRPKAMKRFFQQIKRRLAQGETICFFPEGSISGHGNLMRFRSGVQPLLPENVEVSIIPVRLGMVNGRLLGLHKGKLRLRWPQRYPVNFSITIGEPIEPGLSAFQLRQKISELGAIAEKLVQPGELPLHTSFIFRAKHHPFAATFHDATTGDKLTNFNALVRIILISKMIRKLDKGTSGYTGVLLPNAPITANVLLSVLSADRTPAIINFSAGQAVALDSARRAGVKTILTSRKFLAKLKWEQSPEMICLEDVVPSITKEMKIKALLMAILLPRRTLVRNLCPLSCYNMHHQAVLLFSSGSTGKPKAVMLTQRNINCDILSFIRIVDWSASTDCIAGNLPIFHAFGYTVCFAFPAAYGSPVAYVANPLDSAAIVKSVRDYKITILTATPTFLQKYLMKATAEDLKSLRLLITGAEKLRPELANKYREMTGRDIIEGYGCTELSPIVTINVNNSIYTLGTRADHPGSIGHPLPGVHIRIVDTSTGVEVEPGKEGRMQVRSGIVMKGYLNEPEKTNLVIQDHYYDTGDIAKMDEDGFVYITGRASRFSKIGGEMVPHEGVEDAIAKVRKKEVREVAVTGRSDNRKGERLVVLYAAEDFDVPEVIEGLRQQGLPNIWIPKSDDFVKVDELPLLGSGKLDLLKLKAIVSELE